MYPVHFIEEALFDVENIILWYEEKRIGLSYDFELCLEVGIEEISRNPNAFQKKYKKIRILFIRRFPFGIHYLFENQTITILGVFHTSQSSKNWKLRKP